MSLNYFSAGRAFGRLRPKIIYGGRSIYFAINFVFFSQKIGLFCHNCRTIYFAISFVFFFLKNRTFLSQVQNRTIPYTLPSILSFILSLSKNRTFSSLAQQYKSMNFPINFVFFPLKEIGLFCHKYRPHSNTFGLTQTKSDFFVTSTEAYTLP